MILIPLCIALPETEAIFQPFYDSTAGHALWAILLVLCMTKEKKKRSTNKKERKIKKLNIYLTWFRSFHSIQFVNVKFIYIYIYIYIYILDYILALKEKTFYWKLWHESGKTANLQLSWAWLTQYPQHLKNGN